ncbi:MAG: DNRLRE domain-containing protein [Armatimonadota bacterium]
MKRLSKSQNKIMICFAAFIALIGFISNGEAIELPVLHLRKAPSPLPIVSMLQDPAQSSAWYASSPTWFGLGGKTGDLNHTEVLATYDDNALYLAFMNIDRSTALCPQGVPKTLNTVDSNAVWIETPEKRRFVFIASLDTSYPAQSRRASGEFPSNYDLESDNLPGWTSKGWFAGNLTMQQTIRIPWSSMGTVAPVRSSRWQVNLLNYNQTVPNSILSVSPTEWAPGSTNDASNWGIFAFDEAEFAVPSNVYPEAALTLRPATGFGDEVTLRAGNASDLPNEWQDEAITQSNWNDWDPVDYTIKEYLQFDISMIPQDRVILSATLRNHYRGHFESNPSDIYLNVVRLANEYNPDTVTMLTSPLPVENGFRRLVSTSEVSNWIDFDVTDVISKSMQKGLHKASFALTGSSGDISNGKIWDVSFGRADWYNDGRPQLVIVFGKPGVYYSAPVNVGSLNNTSVATIYDKNKITNGTFVYGTVEGISNTTYWMDPGYAFVNNENVPFMVKAGDINPITGHRALRYMCPVSWRCIQQVATGLVGGKTYTFSGWYKGSAPGVVADVRISFLDAAGKSLGGGGQAVYSGSGNWEQVSLTRISPVGTVKANVSIYNWNSGSDMYMLYSDFQLEEYYTPSRYSETMGVYYPDYPRQDGVETVTTKTDMLIRAGSETSYTGTNVFSTDGSNQTKSQNAAPNQKVTYAFKVKNAGDTNDSFKITGPVSGNGWSVRYYDLNTGADVTSQVTGTGWSSGTLTPGLSKGICVNIKPDASVLAGSVNTLLITATSDADNTKIDAVKTVTSFTANYKADMLIKAGTEASYSGTNVFSTDGNNQTKSLNASPGQKVTYGFRARNAGNANDSFRITGTDGGSGWSVKYYDFTTNADVTSQVTGTGWSSGPIAPGINKGVYANVKPDASIALGSIITLTVTAVSESDNTKTDVVKAVTTCVGSNKPDLLIKTGSESSYTGTGIINTDGTDQTKSQSASAYQKVTCAFRVKNAGNSNDSFKLTGQGSGSGWTVRYYDLTTGAEVTSQVIGTGWLSGALAPGLDKGVYAKITPDATVVSGSFKTLTITAASVGDNTKIDVVKAVTTVP